MVSLYVRYAKVLAKCGFVVTRTYVLDLALGFDHKSSWSKNTLSFSNLPHSPCDGVVYLVT